jgi:serine/threonine protein kinase
MILEAPAQRRDATVASSEPRSDAEHRRDRSGQLIADRYRILRLLGRGGMGSVWLALDCVLNRPVALKESWRSKDTADGDQDSTALREARAASAVSHPGVVQIYDLVVDHGRQWIVMEALSGTTLAQLIKHEGRLPVGRVVSIGLGLLTTVQAIHREGIVHGDIKPSNVQLAATGCPVLTDFGLATSTNRAAAVPPDGLVAGSPPYLAPEVIRNGSRSPASDLFALGATLYEAAEGVRPFDEATPVATTLAVLHHSPRPALQGSPVGQVIDGLLIKDPARRLDAQDAHSWLTEIESELTRPPSSPPLTWADAS